MVKRDELVDFLNKTLELKSFSGDVSNNGLQVEGKADVKKVLFAVDGCLEVFEYAAENNCDFIFVHHGISWGGGMKRWVGMDARRFAALFNNGISLYAAHLPLDAHASFGNNAVLSNIAGLQNREKFFYYDGVEIGFSGDLAQNITLHDLAVKINSVIGGNFILRGNPEHICRKAAVVSGGGGVDSVLAAADAGCDLLITGEMEHIMHHCALEADIAVIALGHYASETTGPKALMEAVSKKFAVDTVFADCPTGL